MKYQIREGAAVMIDHLKDRRVTSFVWRSPDYTSSFSLDRRNLEEIAAGVHYFRINSALLLVSSADLYVV